MCLLFQDVTPENFLAVLKGDASKVKGGSGKVLKRQVIKKKSPKKQNKQEGVRTIANLAHQHFFFSPDLVLFLLAVGPTITCLFTSPIMGHLVFWHFPIVR